MSAPIWYDSTEAGAPTLNNAAGSLIALLRAVLINGFGVKAISSISVASGVATVTCPAHGYSSSYGKWLKISGASAPALDGVKQQTIVDANTFTYPAPGVADGSYTATDARRAPLDWEETHSGTNKAIFKSKDILATGHSLRVDDTSTASMSRWLGIPSSLITDIDTYSGEFPSSAQVSGGAYVQRGAANDSSAKEWVVVGDSRGFFFAARSNTGPVFLINWFGDPEPFYAGDTGCCLLATQSTTSVSSAPSWGLANGTAITTNPASNGGLYAPRGMLSGETTPQYQNIAGMPTTTLTSGAANLPSGSVYANPVIHEPTYVIGQGPFVRARLPGLGWLMADASSAGLTSVSVLTIGSKRYLGVPTRQATGNGAHLIRLDWWR